MCVYYEQGNGVRALPQALVGAQPTELRHGEVGIECQLHTTSDRAIVIVIRRSGQAMARSSIMGGYVHFHIQSGICT